MERLSEAQLPAAYSLYLRHKAFFPLIAAVLLNEQDGVVYTNSEEHPTQAYVEHAFGFAQMFGTPDPAFEQSLQRYLLVDQGFTCTKVRLYTPHCPSFLQSSGCEAMRSWRQHFQLVPTRAHFSEACAQQPMKELILLQADASHLGLIEGTFGVVNRFWRSSADFVNKSNAVMALVGEKPAAICYAAATANGMAEIDVLTLPSYRHLGLAKAAVQLFNQRCLAQHVLPLWDCFTNNAGSIALCQSTGFVPLGEAYPFFTINR